jgi:rhodanese-related sulfurtransferase
MKPLLFLFAALWSVQLHGQVSEYVCHPCGGECDGKVYKKQGSCPVCKMGLVEKALVKFVNLTPKEFCSRIIANPQAIILDVRSEAEFSGNTSSAQSFGHFKNAININVNQLANRIGELSKYKDREILVYCSHSQRSPRACFFLDMQGFKNVKNMSGGVSVIKPKESCFRDTFVAHER